MFDATEKQEALSDEKATPDNAKKIEALENVITTFANTFSHFSLDIVDIGGTIENVAAQSDALTDSFHELSKLSEFTQQQGVNIRGVTAQSNEAVQHSNTLLGQSTQAMEAANGEIGSLVSAVTTMSEQIQGLRQALEKVSRVSDTIEQIANQTNLLALNATIEAARAGEAGRGFAVVAAEVKALSGQTSAATRQIHDTLSELTRESETLIEQGEIALGGVSRVQSRTDELQTSILEVEEAMQQVLQSNEAIADGMEEIDESNDCVVETVHQLDSLVHNNSRMLNDAADRLHKTQVEADKLVSMTIEMNVYTEDTLFYQLAREQTSLVEAAFEKALSTGQITKDDLFDENYTPIAGTDPQQVMTRFTELTDRILPPIQEAAMQIDDRITFCACVDRNGYLPTHNKVFSKPQGNDPVWNASNARNRRIFNDKVGLAAGQNTEPFLLQTYKRDMGGGNYAIMKDLSVPIFIDGKHWGGLRLAYKA